MRIWPEGTIRGFGVASVILGLTGVWFQLDSMERYAVLGPFRPGEAPVFYAEASLDFLLVLGTIVAGVLLWKCGRSGRVISNIVFAAEIIIFLADAVVTIVLGMSRFPEAQSISLNMGAVGGIAHMGTAIQHITLYPVIALAVINLAYRSLNRRKALESRATP